MGMRIVKMSRELFETMFVEGWTSSPRDGERIVCTRGLPVGVKLDAVSMDVFFNTDEIALRFEHESWPDQSGYPIPEVRVEFTIERDPVPLVAGG